MDEHKTTVAEIMTTNPEVVHVDSSAMEAAARMARKEVGLLFVLDGDKLVGTVTDRDITVRCTAEGRDPKTTRIMHVMTPHVVHVRDSDTITELAAVIEREKVRRVAVMNGGGQLAGVVALTNLVEAPTHGEIVKHLMAATKEEHPAHESPTGGRAIPSEHGEVNVYSERPTLLEKGDET